jgi:hypothetical protein
MIIKVLVSFPQQSLWQMVSVSKSTFATRAKRCNDILLKAKVLLHLGLTAVRHFCNDGVCHLAARQYCTEDLQGELERFSGCWRRCAGVFIFVL